MIKSNRRNTFFFIAFLAFVIGVLLGLKLIPLFQNKNQNSLPRVIFGNKVIFVDIAKTPQERQKGLSGREPLGPEHGMLFVFEKEGHHSFWMKDMKFNLDFVFLKGKTIVDLKENIPFPKGSEEPKSVTSQKTFDQVLELEAGTVKLLNLKIGDQAVIFP